MSLIPPKELIAILPERIKKLFGKTLNVSVNCFSISELFFRETELKKMSGNEMLEFVKENFIQVKEFPKESQSLGLIWSDSSGSNTLEHSFVFISQDFIVHKADPRPESKVEMITRRKCIEPYENMPGFQITWHIPKPNTFSRTGI